MHVISDLSLSNRIFERCRRLVGWEAGFGELRLVSTTPMGGTLMDLSSGHYRRLTKLLL